MTVLLLCVGPINLPVSADHSCGWVRGEPDWSQSCDYLWPWLEPKYGHTGAGEDVEDRADQAGDHLQTADLGHHRGEDLPQVTSNHRYPQPVRNNDYVLPSLIWYSVNGIHYNTCTKTKTDIDVIKAYFDYQYKKGVYVNLVTLFDSYVFFAGKSSNSFWPTEF